MNKGFINLGLELVNRIVGSEDIWFIDLNLISGENA